MVGLLIQVLLALLILVVVFYILRMAASAFGVPEIVIQIAGLILGLIFLLFVLRAFGVMPTGLGRLGGWPMTPTGG